MHEGFVIFCHTEESMSAIQPKVQKMIDNPGIYVCTTTTFREHAIVIFSMGGKLIVMEKDKELDPARFAANLVISHGPLQP